MKLNPDQIARVCHEANREYCLMLGDNTQPAWDLAPEWQRASVIDGVNFRLKNPASTPDASHRNWLSYKVADGWKLGPVKDAVKKEHPNIMPFEKLPEQEQRKDIIFSVIVHALADDMKEILG